MKIKCMIMCIPVFIMFFHNVTNKPVSLLVKLSVVTKFYTKRFASQLRLLIRSPFLNHRHIWRLELTVPCSCSKYNVI